MAKTEPMIPQIKNYGGNLCDIAKKKRIPMPKKLYPYTAKDGRVINFKSSWERDYAIDLDTRGVIGWRYECIKFRIGAKGWYTPDFNLPGIVIVEIKGRKREAGMVRFDTAKLLYPEYTWIMFSKKDGRWEKIK